MWQNIVKVCILIVLFLPFGKSVAQEVEANIDAIIENLAEDEENSASPEELIDHFYFLSENPLSINTSTADDLKTIGLLNDFQIHSLIKYREEHGVYQSVYELQLVYGFTISVIKQIQPFITLTDNASTPKLSKSFNHLRHELVARYQSVLEKQKGYIPENDSIPAAYCGDASRQYYRYQLKAGNRIKAGLTFEKDPGEMLFPAKIHHGLDYNSGFLQLNNPGLLRQVNMADYHANWGQGLVLWTGFGLGKSAYVTNTQKLPVGLSKYSSSNENRFLRGISTTLSHKNWDFTLLYSGKKLDASISEDSLNQGISSFYETGLHNTVGTHSKKDQLKEILAGLRLDYKSSKLRLGISAIHHQFDQPIVASETFYKFYDFSGQQYQNIGIDYHYNFGKIVIYGEEAVSSTRGTAVLNGALIKAHPNILLNVLHRAYSKKYHAHYSNAFSEASKIKNERGFYVGMDLFPFPKIKLSAYADAYYFPWATFKCSTPSSGTDYFIQTEYIPNDAISFRLLWKTESKETDYASENQKTEVPVNSTISKYRFDFGYVFSPELELKNRIEISDYKIEKETQQGISFYQDIRYTPEKIPIIAYLRYYLFNMESFDARIYAFENDVLYTFTIPALFDTGIRYYAMVKWQVSTNISFWARYGRSAYLDKQSVSSGDNEIEGNRKSDIKLQIRIKF